MTHPQAQDDEALVRVMHDAMMNIIDGWLINEIEDDLALARAALTALRNHEGRG